MEVFQGKVAVVTGAASGLGRAMARRLAQEGMTSVIADNRFVDALVVARQIEDEGGRAVAMEVDVTNRESMRQLADRVDQELGVPSVLVNNAGVMSPTPVLSPEELGWRWIVDVNLFGVIYGLQTFVPRMLESGQEGHIVNVASLAGMIAANMASSNRTIAGDRRPGRLNMIYGYFATKHAVVAISEALSGELSGTPVGVSVLCPSHHRETGIYDNSARFRPEQYGGPMTPEEIQGTSRSSLRAKGALASVISGNAMGQDPAECAARVVRAIRERHFYIFTHPNSRAAIEERFAQILAGLDDADAFIDPYGDSSESGPAVDLDSPPVERELRAERGIDV
jgi:NAD(P)-dependent dehydrogenase (short-subunit alcohol dehydrogenase family)